jgi:hypothetical protein
MKIYPIKGDENSGPYTRAEIISRIRAGEFKLGDLAYSDRHPKALPLRQLIGTGNADEPAPARSKKPTLDLATIANKQKALIWLTVPWVALGIAPVPIAWLRAETIGFWIVHVATIVVCYELARLLRKNAVVWTLLALVPLVNLFAIARLVAKAAKVLKDNGVRSGFTGVKDSVLNQL